MDNLFSERLKEALNDKNWKPIDLANRSKVDKSAISRYLAGNYKAKSNNLTLIAEALNVSETWLLGYDVPKERQDPLLDPKDTILYNHIVNLGTSDVEKELLVKCTMLDTDQQEAILKMVDILLDMEGGVIPPNNEVNK